LVLKNYSFCWACLSCGPDAGAPSIYTVVNTPLHSTNVPTTMVVLMKYKKYY